MSYVHGEETDFGIPTIIYYTYLIVHQFRIQNLLNVTGIVKYKGLEL